MANTRLHLQGAPQRLASDETRRPHLRALSGASRCCAARLFGGPFLHPHQALSHAPDRHQASSM